MKKLRFLAVALASVCVMPMFGCSNSNDGFDESVDKNRTQIYISHFNGGVGNSWYKPLKERFEKAYENYELNGKKGVQLLISNHKTSGGQEINSVSVSKMDVFFSDDFDYYAGVNKNIFLEITDAVTGNNSDGKTIESKLSPEQKKYFNYNGKYYAIPHYAYYGGLNYNVDLFDDELLYFAADKDNGNEGFIIDLDDVKSNGPDGQAGTYDDGLPATYDEFFKLCDKMVDSNIIPFTWSGEYGKAYFRAFLSRLMATYEGKEQTMMNFTYNGTATHLIKEIKDDGTVVFEEPTTITMANGSDIYSSAGRYYALKFGEEIFSKKDYYDYSNVKKSTDSHTDAQMRYVLSYYEKTTNKPIAFLIDGSYWENEANDVGTFTYLYSKKHISREDTRFGYLPMPRVDESHVGNGKEVMIENGSSLFFINANVKERCPEKIDLLKEFLQFVNTDESLVEFVVNTNSFKALNYDLTPAQENQLSFYTRTVLEARRNSDVVFPNDNNEKYINKRPSLNMASTFDSDTWGFALTALSEGVSAKDYFKNIERNLKTKWSD